MFKLKTLTKSIGLPPDQINVAAPFQKYLERERVAFTKVLFKGEAERILVTTSGTEWLWNGKTNTLQRIGFVGTDRTNMGRPQPKGKLVSDSFDLPVFAQRYLSRLSHANKGCSKNDLVACAIISLYNALDRPGE